MYEPNITEYTTVHVDDNLANNVSVKTRVTLYQLNSTTSKNDLCYSTHENQPAMLISKALTENQENVVSENEKRNEEITKITKKSTIKLDEIEVMDNFNEVMVAKQNSVLNTTKSLTKSKECSVNQEAISNEHIPGDGDTAKTKDQSGTNTEKNFNIEGEKSNKSFDMVIESADEHSNVNIEKHKVCVMEHSLIVSGVNVSEKKKRITVTLEDISGNVIEAGESIKTIIIHSRAIGERKYTIKDVMGIDGNVAASKVISELSDDEIKKFEEDWKYYWIPTITNEEIESGEFEELGIKQSDENITIKETEEKVSVKHISEPTDSDASFLSEDKSIIVPEQLEISPVQECVLEVKDAEDSPVEIFVKKHPLKVFYFGVVMLVMAILVFQCCFLPEYPPCCWLKCILECIEKASTGDVFMFNYLSNAQLWARSKLERVNFMGKCTFSFARLWCILSCVNPCVKEDDSLLHNLPTPQKNKQRKTNKTRSKK